LGDDLRRFLDGEAVAVRPEGPLARLIRRSRQRPVLSAAVAAAVLSTAALGGVGAWTLSERAAVARAEEATDKAADDDLREMVGLLKTSSWVEARAAWVRA
jgi:serine/threonine-protein kinase